MDPTKKDTEIELNDLIDKFRAGVDWNNSSPDYTIQTTTAADTITLSSLYYGTDTIQVDPGATVIGGPGSSTVGSVPWANSTISNTIWSNPLTQQPTSTLELNGSGADLKINGWSLIDAVKRIEERLNLLEVNPELETEWADLKELGDQYRKLEQHIKDKMATWDKLKAMPPPIVD